MMPDTTAQLIEEVQRLGNVAAAQDQALRDISTFARFARKALANNHPNLVDLKLQHIQETLILCGIPQYSDDEDESELPPPPPLDLPGVQP